MFAPSNCRRCPRGRKGLRRKFPDLAHDLCPKGTPPAILAKVEAMLKKVAEDQEFVAALIKLDSEPVSLPPKILPNTGPKSGNGSGRW